jgi:hypothetical protein
MTAPEPPPATPAEHAAAEGIARSVNDWEPDDGAYDLARAALDGLRANGYAVLELPEVQPLEGLINGIGIQIEVLAQDGRGWEVTGCHFPGFEEDHVTIGDLGWRDLDRVERDAGRLLAAVAEIRRMRAEHQGGEPR